MIKIISFSLMPLVAISFCGGKGYGRPFDHVFTAILSGGDYSAELIGVILFSHLW